MISGRKHRKIIWLSIILLKATANCILQLVLVLNSQVFPSLLIKTAAIVLVGDAWGNQCILTILENIYNVGNLFVVFKSRKLGTDRKKILTSLNLPGACFASCVSHGLSRFFSAADTRQNMYDVQRPNQMCFSHQSS